MTDHQLLKSELDFQCLMKLAQSMADQGLLKPEEMDLIHHRLIENMNPVISKMLQKHFT